MSEKKLRRSKKTLNRLTVEEFMAAHATECDLAMAEINGYYPMAPVTMHELATTHVSRRRFTESGLLIDRMKQWQLLRLMKTARTEGCPEGSTIWSGDTGIDRNPADLVEVRRPNDQRDRYLSADELVRLKTALDGKMHRQHDKGINQTFYRLRLLVLIALTTGMRIAEIFALTWSDILYREG